MRVVIGGVGGVGGVSTCACACAVLGLAGALLFGRLRRRYRLLLVNVVHTNLVHRALRRASFTACTAAVVSAKRAGVEF